MCKDCDAYEAEENRELERDRLEEQNRKITSTLRAKDYTRMGGPEETIILLVVVGPLLLGVIYFLLECIKATG